MHNNVLTGGKECNLFLDCVVVTYCAVGPFVQGRLIEQPTGPK